MQKKKLLIRSGIAPYETYSPVRTFVEKPYGNNVGNLVYAYGVFRALTTDPEVMHDADHYRVEMGQMTDADIDYINETYAAYIIPLANAFRESFENRLLNMAAFIRKLKIPAVIVGAGISTPLEYDHGAMPAFANASRAFIDAVLEKSALVGLRGERTAEYLKLLGYTAERDYTVIGCPSVYCLGDTLRIRMDGLHVSENGSGTPEISEKTHLIVADNVFSSSDAHRFFSRVMAQYPNYIFIPQRDAEIEAAYFGIPFRKEFKDAPDYHNTYDKQPYSDGKARLMFNIPSWRKTVENADLYVGARMHGSIMCMLAGVPSLIIPRDTRTLELCEYHGFANFRQDYLTDETRLEDLVAQADFLEAGRRQKPNFEHYRSFLVQNGLDCLFDSQIGQDSPLDERIRLERTLRAAKPYVNVTPPEKLIRYYERGMVSRKRKARKKKK